MENEEKKESPTKEEMDNLQETEAAESAKEDQPTDMSAENSAADNDSGVDGKTENAEQLPSEKTDEQPTVAAVPVKEVYTDERIFEIVGEIAASRSVLRFRPRADEKITGDASILRHSEEAERKSAARGKKFRSILITAAVIASLLAVGIMGGAAWLNITLDPYRPSDYDMTADSAAENEATDSIIVPEIPAEKVKYSVTLDFYDRDDIHVMTEATTLRALLDSIGCKLLDSHRPNIGLDDRIASDCTVTIDKVLYKSEFVTEVIKYDTEVIELDTIPRGEKIMLETGSDGEKKYTYSIEYVNGKEGKRTLVSEEITKEAVTERYELGVGGTFVGNDGVTYTYSYKKVVPASYYSIEGPTYFGYDADETVIAVDPACIPLGTSVYVKNANYDFGKRVAADTGSSAKDWKILIWISRSNPQYSSFVQTENHLDMEIYYID